MSSAQGSIVIGLMILMLVALWNIQLELGDAHRDKQRAEKEKLYGKDPQPRG